MAAIGCGTKIGRRNGASLSGQNVAAKTAIVKTLAAIVTPATNRRLPFARRTDAWLIGTFWKRFAGSTGSANPSCRVPRKPT